MSMCRHPACVTEALPDGHYAGKWCADHYGIYPHKCEHNGCDSIVSYDDEPWCFTHSPDSGSSIPGYSASSKALTK